MPKLNGSAKYILGALLALSVISITGMVINGIVVNPVEEAPRIEIKGKGNNITIANAPAGDPCPDGWNRTQGEDPDSKRQFISCAPTDRHYMLTIYEAKGDQPPEVIGINLFEGRFLSPEEISALYR